MPPATFGSRSGMDPTILEPTDAIIRLTVHLHLRLRPVALPWRRGAERADADGS